MEKTYHTRRLSTEEEVYLRQGEFKNRVKGLKPLSVLGPSNNPYIENYNVKIDLRRVDLGGGQYIHEAIGWRKAPTGTILKFKYSADDAYLHVFKHLESFGIIIVAERSYADPEYLLYFETIYFDVIVKGLRYADETYFRWDANRSLISQMFGASYFLFGSAESNSIRNYLNSLLLEVK
jgi:hypothetical protein